MSSDLALTLLRRNVPREAAGALSTMLTETQLASHATSANPISALTSYPAADVVDRWPVKQLAWAQLAAACPHLSETMAGTLVKDKRKSVRRVLAENSSMHSQVLAALVDAAVRDKDTVALDVLRGSADPRLLLEVSLASPHHQMLLTRFGWTTHSGYQQVSDPVAAAWLLAGRKRTGNQLAVQARTLVGIATADEVAQFCVHNRVSDPMAAASFSLSCVGLLVACGDEVSRKAATRIIGSLEGPYAYAAGMVVAAKAATRAFDDRHAHTPSESGSDERRTVATAAVADMAAALRAVAGNASFDSAAAAAVNDFSRQLTPFATTLRYSQVPYLAKAVYSWLTFKASALPLSELSRIVCDADDADLVTLLSMHGSSRTSDLVASMLPAPVLADCIYRLSRETCSSRSFAPNLMDTVLGNVKVDCDDQSRRFLMTWLRAGLSSVASMTVVVAWANGVYEPNPASWRDIDELFDGCDDSARLRGEFSRLYSRDVEPCSDQLMYLLSKCSGSTQALRGDSSGGVVVSSAVWTFTTLFGDDPSLWSKAVTLVPSFSESLWQLGCSVLLMNGCPVPSVEQAASAA